MGANENRPVAIVGGGIAGLTAALAFARGGARVTVHEQAREIAEVGAALQLSPNGMRPLRALGLGPGIERRGIRARAIVPTDGLTGRVVARFDLSARDYHFLHRADLIDLLARAARQAGAEIVTGSRIELSAAGLPDVPLTIAADGVHSHARVELDGDAEPVFTGHVAWRAIVPREAPPEARLWMLPGRHVVTYPLPGGRLNVVAIEERASFAADGWRHPDDPENLRAAFSDAARELRGILDEVETVYLWGLIRHPVARTWASEGLVLVGDAAHPTLPSLAQGANLAIEDAFALARFCDADASLDRALQHYRFVRRPRVVRAIRTAERTIRGYHLRGPARLVGHAGLAAMGRLAPDLFLGRLDWLYGHDVTA